MAKFVIEVLDSDDNKTKTITIVLANKSIGSTDRESIERMCKVCGYTLNKIISESEDV